MRNRPPVSIMKEAANRGGYGDVSPRLAATVMWLIGIAFYGGIGGYHIVPQLRYLHDLSKSSRVTRGEIVETYPQMHSTCKYRFSVDGHSYDHTGRSCGDS